MWPDRDRLEAGAVHLRAERMGQILELDVTCGNRRFKDNSRVSGLSNQHRWGTGEEEGEPSVTQAGSAPSCGDVSGQLDVLVWALGQRFGLKMEI